ncbi:hypothetical protein [Thermus sp.]|uniref:hypothetical protein n=1 Tax=Thermus sp. TaxID=275 RepID=UPI0025D8B2C7|nr:hypothetical protein [Thermus sp.]MCS6869653.1 hypothetical protein [Thermus sp.]
MNRLEKLAQKVLRLIQEKQEKALQDDATVKEDAPKVGSPQGTPTARGVGAPPGLPEPRWVLTVAPAQGPLTLYRVLYRLARGVLQTRGLSRRVGTVVLHLPVDLLAAHLGVHRATVWRWTKVLEARGLVATRTHYGTLDGRTVATGTLWAVRLRPGKARLTYEDLRHPWRNLEDDRRRGATAWAWKGLRPDLKVLLLWALGARRGPGSPAPGGAGAPVDLYAIPYLLEASKGELPGLITALAEHLAARLRDHGSHRFYAGLLWKVVRRELDPWRLLAAIQRVQTDMQEGWARRPGALLVSRLNAV